MKAWLVAGLALLGGCAPAAGPEPVEWVSIEGGSRPYPAVDASGAIIEEPSKGFSIMRRQVSQAEYAACVADGGCPPLDDELREADSPELPVTGVSWLDATAYAQWLSRRSGVNYRLPGYGEWLLAAGSAYTGEQPLLADATNPALRWLADYERESQRQPLDPQPQPFASQGVNDQGLLGIAGNVWEWTNSCFSQGPYCGVRIAAGQHPSGLSEFVRDPISGACSVGVPPANLGFRLVRD